MKAITSRFFICGILEVWSVSLVCKASSIDLPAELQTIYSLSKSDELIVAKRRIEHSLDVISYLNLNKHFMDTLERKCRTKENYLYEEEIWSILNETLEEDSFDYLGKDKFDVYLLIRMNIASFFEDKSFKEGEMYSASKVLALIQKRIKGDQTLCEELLCERLRGFFQEDLEGSE